jgi:hypothetical protein
VRSSVKARLSAIEEKLNLAFPKQDIGYCFLEPGEEVDDLKKGLSEKYSNVCFLPVGDPAVIRLKAACVKYGELTKNHSGPHPPLTDEVLEVSHEYLRACLKINLVT